MTRQLSVAVLAGLALAACSELPKDAPIEDREGKAKVATAAPAVVEAAPSVQAAPPAAAEPAKPPVATVQQPTVETRALPAAGTQIGAMASVAPSASPVAAGAQAGGATTPGEHKNPASPLAKRVVYFEFDSAVIAPEFQPIIDVHAAYLKANKGYKVILQGHADERGSREYNLALGQRRAESVRQALSLLGVADAQMEAVSLGEEKPAVEGHDEAAWKMNRRAEIHYQDE